MLRPDASVRPAGRRRRVPSHRCPVSSCPKSASVVVRAVALRNRSSHHRVPPGASLDRPTPATAGAVPISPAPFLPGACAPRRGGCARAGGCPLRRRPDAVCVSKMPVPARSPGAGAAPRLRPEERRLGVRRLAPRRCDAPAGRGKALLRAARCGAPASGRSLSRRRRSRASGGAACGRSPARAPRRCLRARRTPGRRPGRGSPFRTRRAGRAGSTGAPWCPRGG